jgi:hypothetical protein
MPLATTRYSASALEQETALARSGSVSVGTTDPVNITVDDEV